MAQTQTIGANFGLKEYLRHRLPKNHHLDLALKARASAIQAKALQRAEEIAPFTGLINERRQRLYGDLIGWSLEHHYPKSWPRSLFRA